MQASSFQPDTVTLSAVFPPPLVDGANLLAISEPWAATRTSGISANTPAANQAAGPSAQAVESANATTPANLSQQEQRAQLDQALEQLGIKPQIISLDKRLALLKSANDPPRKITTEL